MFQENTRGGRGQKSLKWEERVNYTLPHTEMMRALTVWFPFDQCSTEHHIEKVKE